MLRWLASLAIVWLLLATSVHADITTGLASYWPLDGDGNDASGNARHLTVGGTITYGAGVKGQAGIGLNNTNKFTTNPTWLNGESSYTVSHWVKFASVTASGASSLSLGGNASTNVTVFYPSNNALGNGVRVFAANAFVVDRNDSIPPTGEWIFLCWRVLATNSAKLDIYVPSTETWHQNTTTSNCSMPNPTTGLAIGTYHNSSQPFDGDVDEVYTFTRALSDADIIELMEAAQESAKPWLYVRINEVVQ